MRYRSFLLLVMGLAYLEENKLEEFLASARELEKSMEGVVF